MLLPRRHDRLRLTARPGGTLEIGLGLLQVVLSLIPLPREASDFLIRYRGPIGLFRRFERPLTGLERSPLPGEIGFEGQPLLLAL